MNLIWKLFGRKRDSTPRRAEPLEARLEEVLKTCDRHALRAELETFERSNVWKALRAFIGSEKDTHETLLHQALGHSNLHCEASYEAGCYKSLQYVNEFMVPYFLDYLKTGKPPGVEEGEGPGAEEETG